MVGLRRFPRRSRVTLAARLVLFLSVALAAAPGRTASPSDPAPTHALRIDVQQRHQQIAGWGTSMVSWKVDATPYAEPAWRRAYRDLGLNLLRVRLGKEALADASGDLRVPVPLGPDLDANVARMDFDHASIRAFGEMAAWLRSNALEPERVRITGAVWSPPHWMKGPTGREQAHVSQPGLRRPTPWLSQESRGDSIGGRLLQTPENLEQFGRYLAAWITGFERRYGVPIYAASLQNEVSYENPFDSTSYLHGPTGQPEQWWQYADALQAVKRVFIRERIRTRILGPHVAHVGRSPERPWGLVQQMRYIAAVRDHSDPDLHGFLWAYASNGYLAGDEAGVRMWAAYLRGTAAVPGPWPDWAEGTGIRRDGKPVWVCEASGESPEWLGEPGAPQGEGALHVAQRIHNALVHADASAYLYWQLSDAGPRESRFTLLGHADLASPTRSLKYAAFKQFSRHVRPGAVRVGARFENGWSSVGGRSRYDTRHALNASAFLHESDRQLTVVLVNLQAVSVWVDLRLPPELGVRTLERHRSDSAAGHASQPALAVVGQQARLEVPAHSVVTLEGRIAAQEPSG